MRDLSPEARRLIEATRDLDAPGARDRDRLRAALYTRLATPPTAAAATKAATIGLLAKAAAGAVLLAALGVGTMRPRPTTQTAARSTTLARPARAAAALPPPPAPAEHAAPITIEPVRPAAHAMPVRPVERRASAPIAPPPVAPPPPIDEPVVHAAPLAMPAPGSVVSGSASPPAPTVAPADPLASELSLLGDAQVAFDHRHADRALRLLDAYAAAHPSGSLGVEALALRVLTLCALDRRDEAREFAARLRLEAPRSPSAGRVRSSCAGDGQ